MPERVIRASQYKLDHVQVAMDAKMGVDVEEYVASFRTDLCDAVAAWSRGAKFAEIMKMTDVFEARAPCSMELKMCTRTVW